MLDIYSRPPNGNLNQIFCSKLKLLRSEIKKNTWANSSVIDLHLTDLHSKQAICLYKINVDPLNVAYNHSLKAINLQLLEFSSLMASWVIQMAKSNRLSQGEDDLKFLYARIRARNSKRNVVVNLSYTMDSSSRDEFIRPIINHFQNM